MSTQQWVQPFLRALASGSTVSEAAAAGGVTSGTAYGLRQRDVDFREAWDQALEDSTDILEREARRRAVEGVDKGVWHQGVQVGTERVYSDALLALLLKGRRKGVFADRTELTGANGAPVAIDATTRAARIAALLQAAKDRSDIA